MKKNFTLLELLLVTVILGLLASTALLVVDHSDDQFRYEETKIRLALIEKALMGKDFDGLSGYIADTGQLPGSISDLTVNPGIDAWEYNENLGFGFGWRGPYISTFDAVFKDGWGNDWQELDLTGGFSIKSYGKDREVLGSAIYENDIVLTIPESRYKNPAALSITASITNDSSKFTGSVSLFVLYPSDDLPADFSLDTWDAVIYSEFITNEISIELKAGETSEALTFTLTPDPSSIYKKMRVLLVEQGASGTTISDKIISSESIYNHLTLDPSSYTDLKVNLRIE